MSQLSYTWRLRLFYLAGFVATIAFGLTAGFLSRVGEPGEYFWLVFLILIALSLGFALLVRMWWNALGDVQKAGQTNAWYWGGSAGAFLVVLYLIAERALHTEFGQGAFVMFMAQAAGGALMWLVWRLRGMGRGE